MSDFDLGDDDVDDRDFDHEDGRNLRPDSDQFVVFSTTPRIRHTTPWSTTLKGYELFPARCDKISLDYSVIPGVIAVLCFVFGILYCFFGYRYFKATMFMTGFIFGSLVTYLICLEETVLPVEGKVGVAIGAGVLCGLITLLVQYVGLFMTGFHLGFLLAVTGLVVAEWFVHPSTKWVPIGAVFGTGLVFALLGLYFQKRLTMLATAMIGAALISVAVDYFVEMFLMLYYILDRLKAVESGSVCWFSWIIVGLWPLTFFVGVVGQCSVTGKGFSHQDAVHSRRQRKTSSRRGREEDAGRTQPSNYKHLYQIRRANGDVIVQNVCQVRENGRSADVDGQQRTSGV